MTNAKNQKLLGERLGLTVHQSILRWKVKTLMHDSSGGEDVSEEEWLVALANHRHLNVVFCANRELSKFKMPDEEVFPDEELITALCLLQSRDQPQMLRLAAQRISRGNFSMIRLLRLAEMERIQTVLKTLAATAVKIEAKHPAWNEILTAFSNIKPLKEPLLHWTRLAEPIMTATGVNASSWRLIA